MENQRSALLAREATVAGSLSAGVSAWWGRWAAATGPALPVFTSSSSLAAPRSLLAPPGTVLSEGFSLMDLDPGPSRPLGMFTLHFAESPLANREQESEWKSRVA